MVKKERLPLITLSGTVESIVFQNPETGYVVMELDTGTTLETVVGEMPGVTAGEELSVTGRYSTHPTYGQQFRAEISERRMPATATAILKYLSSGIIKGVGPALARRIVDKFGGETLEIIEKDHKKLSEVRGVSDAKAADIFEQYSRIFGLRSVMLYLAKFGVDSSASIRIWKLWGPMTKEMVEENPYLLINEPVELEFETADMIAMSVGFPPDDPRRLKAGLSRVLTHNLRNGHTCLPRDRLLLTASEMLESKDPELLEKALEDACHDRDVVTESFDGREFVYLARLYEAETFIAGRIALLLSSTPPGENLDFPKKIEKDIESLEKNLNIEYDGLQKKAIGMALSSKIFILTGGPGTGKTTTLNAILALLEEKGEKVSLAAPTGRAAKRISEVTGRDASTVHRLLEVDYRDPDTGRHKFKRDESNPLRSNAVILDEVSMVDTLLMQSLLKATRMTCRLILVGDPDQLPSVGPGNLLRDLIASDVIPTVHLNRIFRQAELSAIVTGAHAIVAGETPPLNIRDSDFFFLEQTGSYQDTLATVADLCLRRLPAAYKYDPVTDIQVIAPSRVGALGTVELNRALQQALNPKDSMKAQFSFGSATFREGDKVMQVKNNYDIPWKRDDSEKGAGVFNGDIGIIEMIDRPSGTILIRFDDRVAQYSIDMADEIEHAYAVTVHKSQGSEFNAVIIPLMNYHERLYYRNILYTGVTRAKKLLIMLGKPDTVRRMVDNDRKVLRYTKLRELLTIDS